MQTVGAQWLLVDRPGATTLVALVQTANTIPFLLLGLPGGVLADLFDRRRLLIGVQGLQVVVGIGLAALTITGYMPPALLLGLTFLLGCGAALSVPALQAIIPDLVPRGQLYSASALGSVSINVARAVGPAVAGVLIARLGAGPVFALNALSFLVLGLVVLAWRPEAVTTLRVPEPFISALRAGGRYVRYAPVVRRILARAALFLVPASALWALLPVLARQRLGMGASGYGILLGALGAGAIGGAFALPRMRRHLSGTNLLLISSLLYAAVLLAQVLVRNLGIIVPLLVVAGVSWVIVLSSINASVQLFLPAWIRARGLATYQMVLFGT